MSCGCAGTATLEIPWWIKLFNKVKMLITQRMLGSKVKVTCTEAPTLNSVSAADGGFSNCPTGWQIDGSVTLSDPLPLGFEIAWYFGFGTSDPPTTTFQKASRNLAESFNDTDIGADGGGSSVTHFARVGAEIRIEVDSTVCDGKDDSSSISRTANECFV